MVVLDQATYHKIIAEAFKYKLTTSSDRIRDSEGQEEARAGTKQRKMEKDEVDTRPRKCSRRYEEESVHSLDDISAESSLSLEGRENSASSSLGQSSEAEEPSTSNYKPPSDDLADSSTMLMKLLMEGNRFYYIPLRKHVKPLDYLHYVQKRDNGSLMYAAHTYYYILHACAREAQVDIRIMHQGVLSLERRLAWIEKTSRSLLAVYLMDESWIQLL